ncbi:MAG TPA: thioesterase family protein [Kofleriaceae bacterium]|nr:thioesterase family protein [Kofleriaceae bacterium]
MPAFRCELPVRFDDVDFAGIVYYPRFFHYFHLALEEMFRARGGERGYIEVIEDERIGFPAVRAECDYRAPLKFGDVAEVEMTLEHMGEKSARIRYEVSRKGIERIVCAVGKVTCAFVDLDKFRAVKAEGKAREVFLSLAAPHPATV